MEGTKSYFPVELVYIKPEAVVGCNLHFYLREKEQYVLYKKAGLLFTQRDLERLISSRVQYLYAEGKDEKRYLDYLEENLSYHIGNQELEPEKKSTLLYRCATHRVSEILDDPRVGESIKKSGRLVENSIDYILQEPNALKNLTSLMSHDYYTYTHSVNVCFFCVALAYDLGFDDKSRLYEVGIGTLLHDIGKRMIDPRIISKKGKLTSEEMDLVRRHPLYGLDVLKECEQDIPEGGRMIVAHHHEKMNGSGYPFGLKGEDIHWYARIACIADIFDALTTRRSYKGAISPFKALKLMKGEMRDELDEGYLNSFIRTLKG